MKKALLLCIIAVMMCGTSYGWDRRAHATIAKIAENHLNPKTKALLDSYLDGKSIVYYASYADDYKQDMPFDVGFEPANVARKIPYPHTFEANDDCTVFDGLRRGDNYVKNCIYLADKFAKELKEGHKTMNDSLRFHKIVMLVHWVGDMHCPQHIRYPEDQTTGQYKVKYGNREVKYHTLWDGILFGQIFPWSFSDCALMIDTFAAEDVAKIQQGWLFDWGKETAIISRPVHNHREGAVIDSQKYRKEYGWLAEQQVRNAGYRLAKLLNEILK